MDAPQPQGGRRGWNAVTPQVSLTLPHQIPITGTRDPGYFGQARFSSGKFDPAKRIDEGSMRMEQLQFFIDVVGLP
jgi:hypothetical protein